jgi:hypothetical protein
VIRAIGAGVVFCLLPIAAAAQSGGAATTASQPSQGPMIVEQIHSGFLAAPDVKVTEVDKRTSELAGGYAGWVVDDALFVGGGGYWLANQSSDRKMAYGGLVVQWLARTNERFGFSAKGLFGGGQATLSSTVPQILGLPDRRELDRLTQAQLNDLVRSRTVNTRIRFRENFFVAEPEIDALVRLTRHLRLTVGAGYRFIGAEGRDEARLRGAVGSVGLQIGGGS